MQFIKKASSLIIALSLAIGSCAFTALAMTEAVTDGKYSYSEDFSAYDSVAFADATAVTSGKVFNTDWTVSSKYTSGGEIKAYGAKGTPSGYNGAMVVVGKANEIGTVNFKNVENIENGYKFSVTSNYSAQNGFWLAEMGVRFMVDEASDTYYEIATTKSTSPKYSFVKKAGGSETVRKTGTAAIQTTAKIKYEVSVAGASITYKVTNGSTVLLEGTYTDANPIEYTNKTVPVAAYVLGAQKIEFDDFKLQQLIPYIDTDEPSPAFYKNIAYGKTPTEDSGKFVYDLGEKYVIRRIVADGSGVEISTDGNEYTSIASSSDFVGGCYLNRKDITPVQYVRLATDAAEIYVDANATEAVSTYVGRGAQFAMYVNKSTDGITWKSNSDCVSVANGLITGKKTGTAKVTAQKGSITYTINVEVGSEIDGAIESGNTDAYIAKVEDAVNAYDDAIKANDAEALAAVVFGEGAGTLADIGDFDATVLDGLTDDEKATLMSGIIAAGTVVGDAVTTDSVKALISKVNAEAEKAADVTLVNKIKEAASDATALRAIVTGDVETSLAITEYVDELVFEEDFTDAQLAEIVNATLADYAEVKAGDGVKLMAEIVEGVNALTKPFVFEDDFSYADGYDAVKTFVPGEQMNEDWSVSSQYNSYGNLRGYFGVSEPYPASGGALSYKGFGKHTGAINLRHIPELGGKYKIELDQYQYNESHNDTRMGIRFMVNETNGSYYQILSTNVKDKFTFKKVTSQGDVATSVHESESVVHVRPNKVHYEITIGGDLIEYKVSCNGSTLLEGAYKDLAPFEYTTGTIPLALVVEGDNAPLEVDDVKLTALTKPYIELPEPSPVIYNNVAENAAIEGNVITLEEKAAIRRIRFVNDYEACGVRASVDGVSWDNLATLEDFKNGEWLNRISNRKYKYVEIANGAEVKLYTDVCADDTYNYYIGTDADIALYELGEEVDAPVWTVSDPSVATVKSGKLRAKKAGNVTVSIIYNKVELETNFKISSKLDEAVANGTVSEYLEALKPTYDAINNAIDADDTAALKTALSEAASAGKITDFDGSSITDLTDGALTVLANKLIAGGAKGTVSTSNINSLYSDIYTYIPQAKAADMIEKTITAAQTDDTALAQSVFDGSSLSAFEKTIEFVPAEDIDSVQASDLVLAAERMAAKYAPFNATASALTEDDVQKFMDGAKAEIKNIKACNVVKGANDAIAANNAATLARIITGDGAGTMGSVEIFDGEAVKGLSAEEKTALAQRVITYGKFETSGDVNSADVDKFIKTIDVEYAVGKVSGISDVADFEIALEIWNKYLDLPLDDAALDIETDTNKTVKDETLATLAGKTFASRDDLYKRLTEDFVLRAFKNLNAYQSVAPLYTNYNDVIGGDDAKLADIILDEGEAMLTFGTYIINNIPNINNLTDIAELLRDYEIGGDYEIGDGGAGAGGSSGGGFGGGGGGGISGGSSIAVGTGIINDINANKNLETSVYKDVPTTHWAYNFIKYLNAHGSISGYGDGTFAPENNVKRSEFIKILINELGFAPATVVTPEYAEEYNAKATEEAKKADEEAAAKAAEEGKEAPKATVPQLIEATAKPFEDVEITSWYAPYIIAAKEQGLVMGDGVNCNPEANITREEMAAVIYRALKLKGTELDGINSPKAFADESAISDWARSPIMQLYKYGIINGVSETEIAPQQKATRAQVAKMIGDLSMKITAKEAAANEE